MAPLTVEDRLLINALRIENGCQTVETTHVFMHES